MLANVVVERASILRLDDLGEALALSPSTHVSLGHVYSFALFDGISACHTPEWYACTLTQL